MRPSLDEPIRIYRYSARGWEAQETRVIEEANVSLTINGELWLIFTCTPTHLEELCVGFLFNEGIIQSIAEIQAITVCDNRTNVDIWLDRSIKKPTQWRRTSGCTGGVSMVEPDLAARVALNGGFCGKQVWEGMTQLLEAQTLYRRTRGIHCSAIFDGDHLGYIAEDIGRHNTLDKLAGMVLMAPMTSQPVLVFTTGRVSSEMLQKSVRLSAIAVISRTSPTTLSIQMARRLGVTLIGYARRDQFQVYSHPERLAEFAQPFPIPDLNQVDSSSSSISA